METHKQHWQNWLRRTPEAQIPYDLYKVAKDQDEDPPKTFGDFCKKYERQLNVTIQEKRNLK